MADILVPGEFRRGNLRSMEESEKQRESAVFLLDMICRQLGLDNLAQTEFLDMGCGSKFTEALIGEKLPIGHYVGVDVYKDMVDYLRDSVDDEHFEYHHMNSHNEMYNPDGEVMTADTRLPLGDATFDIISLFSVFTHLAPHDYSTMLKMLRPYIKPDGHMIFSVFINEPTEGGHGLVDSILKTLKQQGKLSERDENNIPDFNDAGSSPLQWALYSRSHALELFADTGWEVVSLNQPELHVQHYFICKPI